MSNWRYDSGGHKKDHKKYKENYEQVFTSEWPCKECGGSRAQGHKNDCSKHWRNKS